MFFSKFRVDKMKFYHSWPPLGKKLPTPMATGAVTVVLAAMMPELDYVSFAAFIVDSYWTSVLLFKVIGSGLFSFLHLYM